MTRPRSDAEHPPQDRPLIEQAFALVKPGAHDPMQTAYNFNRPTV